MAKIIKYANAGSSNILHPDDLEALHNLYEYKARIEEQCRKKLAATAKKAQQIKDKAYREANEAFKQEQQQLLAELEGKLDQSFKQIHDDIYHLIYRLLQKLGIGSIDINQVQGLIEMELDHYKLRPEQIVVYMNDESRQELIDLGKDKLFQIKIDEKLQRGECRVESNLYIFKLNLKQAVDKLNLLLSDKL